MNFSIMTISFPMDTLTQQELQQLCNESYEADHSQYDSILNISLATDYEAKGFIVLAYDDEADRLVGAASAIDLMGLYTFEWSLLVHPMYRRLGLGAALYSRLQQELELRSATGQLALMMAQKDGVGQHFLQQRNFAYSFSEASLAAKAQRSQWSDALEIREFQETDTSSLVDIFMDAFGDDAQEALELVQYNATNEELRLWVSLLNDKVVGTVTTRKTEDAEWITALAVHSSMKGKGIGTALIQKVKQLAFEEGLTSVKLDVELENERAFAIYEKTGFVITAQVDYFAKV